MSGVVPFWMKSSHLREVDGRMNWLVFHIVSGQSFFTGIACLIFAACASRSSQPIAKRLTGLVFAIGLIAIVASSTPLPYAYYAVAGAITAVWVASAYVGTWRNWSAVAVIAAWSIGAAMEIPYHFSPVLTAAPTRSLSIIGDSVTAGMGGEDTTTTWPALLATDHAIQIQDISHVGETASTALKRLPDNPITAPVLLIEIGGNDVLGVTTPPQFAHDLDALVAHVRSPGRQILMFELPLPPLAHEYGRIQRQVASKYGVLLVPKRIFLKIIAVNDLTLDSIHLSQAGHRKMADCVWQLVRPAFAP